MTERAEAGATPAEAAYVALRGLEHVFDISPPLLQRLLTGSGRRRVRAVDGVGFEVRRGTTFGLVGESGCGKSTIARLLAGLYRPTAGTIAIDGDRVSGGERGRHRVQIVFQDPFSSLDARWRVGDIVAEPIRASRLIDNSDGIAERVAQLLAEVGLDSRDALKYPHQFSGGQRQRIAIARALAGEPELLICDEPTSALDVSVQAQILNLMKDLQASHGLTILFISHNLPVVDFMSDVVGVMYLGRLVEVGPPAQVFGAPLHPYTRALIASVPDLGRRSVALAAVEGEVPSPIDRPQGCAFHPRCRFADDRCRRESPALRPLGDQHVSCHAAADARLPAFDAPASARPAAPTTG